jgi:hypothetical protein
LPFQKQCWGAKVSVELLERLEKQLKMVVRSLHEQMNAPKAGVPLSATLALQSRVRARMSAFSNGASMP